MTREKVHVKYANMLLRTIWSIFGPMLAGQLEGPLLQAVISSYSSARLLSVQPAYTQGGHLFSRSMPFKVSAFSSPKTSPADVRL